MAAASSVCLPMGEGTPNDDSQRDLDQEPSGGDREHDGKLRSDWLIVAVLTKIRMS